MLKNIAKSALRAYLGFIAIGIVIYGIYSGKFSPTEAAGVTVGFCLLAGILFTKEFKVKELPNILMRSGQITGMLVPLIAISVVMQQILSLLGAGEAITAFIESLGGKYIILLTCMAMVLLAGTVLESLPNTIIFGHLSSHQLLTQLVLTQFTLLSSS